MDLAGRRGTPEVHGHLAGVGAQPLLDVVDQRVGGRQTGDDATLASRAGEAKPYAQGGSLSCPGSTGRKR
jgi:hypothetical protein